ncbi:3-keto-disaccharide hydrolase [Dysgonomonas reticulitermitis]
MKKVIYSLSCLIVAGALTACGGKSTDNKKTDSDSTKTENAVPEYKELDKAQVDISKYTADKNGYITLFDGKSTEGWRGYGKDNLPGKWSIDNGALKFTGAGGGEAQEKDGGDIIFAHKFKNFILELEWKVAKGSNSGIFYLAQEIESKDKDGNTVLEHIYISSPEYQVLDNANHVDAMAGKDGNRQSGSLYDMIPAKPQNARPYGEWNKTEIVVSKGTVFHKQNGETVLEYHLWTPEWTKMLEESKFSKEKWPLAFELLNNCGGPNREGYIGLQDHSDDVWFRNIKIKVLD